MIEMCMFSAAMCRTVRISLWDFNCDTNKNFTYNHHSLYTLSVNADRQQSVVSTQITFLHRLTQFRVGQYAIHEPNTIFKRKKKKTSQKLLAASYSLRIDANNLFKYFGQFGFRERFTETHNTKNAVSCCRCTKTGNTKKKNISKITICTQIHSTQWKPTADVVVAIMNPFDYHPYMWDSYTCKRRFLFSAFSSASYWRRMCAMCACMVRRWWVLCYLLWPYSIFFLFFFLKILFIVVVDAGPKMFLLQLASNTTFK